MAANQDVKQEAKKRGIKLWQIAEAYGVNDGNFSRLLRHELRPEDKAKIRQIIRELAKN